MFCLPLVVSGKLLLVQSRSSPNVRCYSAGFLIKTLFHLLVMRVTRDLTQLSPSSPTIRENKRRQELGVNWPGQTEKLAKHCLGTHISILDRETTGSVIMIRGTAGLSSSNGSLFSTHMSRDFLMHILTKFTAVEYSQHDRHEYSDRSSYTASSQLLSAESWETW